MSCQMLHITERHDRHFGMDGGTPRAPAPSLHRVDCYAKPMLSTGIQNLS